ncbi:hypothetical protein JCM10207_002221 [Rhodosporidiobolus poonsookiae]
MPRSKPKFDLHDGPPETASPIARSSSRDRSHRLSSSSPSRVHPPPPLTHHSSSRRYSNDSPSSHYLVLQDVDEEAALESSGETDSLLGRTHSRRRLTVNGQNGYGTADVEPGALLARQESALRLAGLIDDRAGEYEKFRKTPEELKAMPRKLRKFYERQNETLDQFNEVDEVLENARLKVATGELLPQIPASHARDEELRASIKWAINVNFAINILLLFGKIAVVLLSHSMSLIASTVDSAMDFLSTLIIFYTSQQIASRDWKSRYVYPTGKSRMEPLGVLVFSVAMISSFMQVFIESVQKLFDKNLDETVIPPVALGVMAATIVIKMGVWLSCRAIKSASVEALQQDAENDIVFNFFSILFPFIGQLVGFKQLDPIGGALLSVYIIIEWVGTLLENVRKLTGCRAAPSEHQRIAYLLTRFSPLVTAVQHLSLYYAGEGLICEVDIVLPVRTSLQRAHDLGEAAQYAIEELDGVQRAFVHVDVSVNPLSGHLDRFS